VERLTSADGSFVGNIEWARSPWARLRGLLGRGELEADVAFVLCPAYQVHTFFLGRQIDVALCSAEWQVLWVRKRMPVNRISALLPSAHFAIEMHAGCMPGWLEEGSRLVVSE
jgi:uncharacterized protein